MHEARHPDRSRAWPLIALAGIAVVTILIMFLRWTELRDVLLLRRYNTRLVVLTVTMLGATCGLVGSFLLLRKRALLADALSHATLPGIAIAFMVMVAFGGTGKDLVGLLLGATISGVLGIGAVLGILRSSRLKEDAALGIVLSVFFGIGVALLGLVQIMPTGNAAGLEAFIYGRTASMIRSDQILIGIASIAIGGSCALLFKEFKLLCFDEAFAAAQGWPVARLDVILMTLVVAVTVIGLQAVGLILMVAMLVIPAAASRFWTDRLPIMSVVAMGLGGASGWIGASISALYHDLPAGAVIVTVAASFFIISMLIGPSGGVVHRWVERRGLRRKVERQHLLRAVYESLEERGPHSRAVTQYDLLHHRGWAPRELERLTRRAVRDDLLDRQGDGWILTAAGHVEAARVVRAHRLWELFLITHADIAPSHVDRDADQIEHVLDPQLVTELEAMLGPPEGMPASPHVLRGGN